MIRAITNQQKLTASMLSVAIVFSACVPSEEANAQNSSSRNVTVTARGVLPVDGSFSDLIYTLPRDVTELSFGSLTGPPGVNLTNVQGIEQLTDVETLVLRLVSPSYNERSMIVPDGVTLMSKLKAIEFQIAVLRDFRWLADLPGLTVLSFTRGTRVRDNRQSLDFSNLDELQLLWVEDLTFSDNDPNELVFFRVGPSTRYVFLGSFLGICCDGDVIIINEDFLQSFNSVERLMIHRDLVDHGLSQGHSQVDFEAYDSVIIVESEGEAERLLPRNLQPSRIFGEWEDFPSIGE